MKVGGIVLCGGKSSRMGRTKATLPFGPELMLQRVVRLLSLETDPVIVVAAPDQELPDLPDTVRLTRDRREHRGPLEGLYAGLLGLADQGVEAAYASSCDVPLLARGFVRRMIDLLGDYQIAVPQEDRFCHPLAAVYRTNVIGAIKQLLDQDQLRPAFLFDRVPTLRVPTAQLAEVDPRLDSLANLNRPQDYMAALTAAGFTASEELASEFESDSRTVSRGSSDTSDSNAG